MTNSLLLKIAIEIVDFPIKNGGSFHSYVNVYQRVISMDIKTGWWFQFLWKIWKSLGMIIWLFPIDGKKMFQTTNIDMIGMCFKIA